MKHTWTISIFLLVLFFAAQLIGLYIIQEKIDVSASAEQGKIVFKGTPGVETPNLTPLETILYISTAVIIGTLLILLIVKFNQIFMWKLWFYSAVAVCLYVALKAFLPTPYAIILALLLGFFKVIKPNIYIHNLTELFVYGGLAVIFVPILNVRYAFILLLALSAYDMYAVWQSKHMIKMAKFQTESGIFAGLLVPYHMPSRKGVKAPVRTAVLGGGDIGFPLLLAGTVLTESFLKSPSTAFLNATVVVIGASAALFILLMLSQKDKFYPAMPFLTLGCALGYLATFLL